ncbi:MAG: TIGR02147 family protein [Bdellovibrionota bacterium]
MKVIDQILLGAKNSSEATRNLYLHYKSIHRNYSLSYICQKAGIPSKGYLSDVMRGTRILNMKYMEGLIKVFKLSHSAGSFYQTLVRMDHEKDPDEIKRLLEKRKRAEKAMKVSEGAVPAPLTSLFFNLELFCRMGLFNNKATRSDLLKVYGKAKSFEVEKAIENLKSSHLIAEDGGVLTLINEQFKFETSNNNSHIEFLQECLKRVAASIGEWYLKPDLAYVESSIISVEEAKYRKLLPQIRSLCSEIQSDLESGKADKLILFNVQVMPLDK